MALLQLQVETDRPGLVKVRAKAAAGREMDSRPLAGFYIRRRYEGDTFAINDWREFSPRWMEFIEEPPKEWLDAIEKREGVREIVMAEAAANGVVEPARPSQFAMSQSNPVPRSSNEFDYGKGRPKMDKTRDSAVI